MLKSPDPSVGRRQENRSASPKSKAKTFQESIAAGLANSNPAICRECGSKSNLLVATLSLWGTDQSWEIVLPLCDRCASEVRSALAIKCEKEGVPSMNNEKWEEFYMAAAMEVDGKRMPDRIAGVREAIQGRLQDLQQSSNHHAERDRMKATLEHLKILESESQEW